MTAGFKMRPELQSGGGDDGGGHSATSVVMGGSIKKGSTRAAGVDCVISSLSVGCYYLFHPYPKIDR